MQFLFLKRGDSQGGTRRGLCDKTLQLSALQQRKTEACIYLSILNCRTPQTRVWAGRRTWEMGTLACCEFRLIFQFFFSQFPFNTQKSAQPPLHGPSLPAILAVLFPLFVCQFLPPAVKFMCTQSLCTTILLSAYQMLAL